MGKKFPVKVQERRDDDALSPTFGNVSFFYPADPWAVTQGGLPGFDNPTWLELKGSAKTCLDHRFQAQPLPTLSYV